MMDETVSQARLEKWARKERKAKRAERERLGRRDTREWTGRLARKDQLTDWGKSAKKKPKRPKRLP